MLPVELLLNLSKFLNIRDRLRLRCVCKEWLTFIDEFCLDELLLFIRVYPTLELWNHNSRAIEFRNVILLRSDHCLLDDARFQHVFRNVRNLFLSVRAVEDVHYRLEFPRLQNLELRKFYLEEGDVEMNFPDSHGRTPNLKLFRVAFDLNMASLRTFHVNYLDGNLQLNFPQIYFFSYDRLLYYQASFGASNFKQRGQFDRITHLRCQDYQNWARKLRNLKVLYCRVCFQKRLKPVLLTCYPQLECIYLDNCDVDRFHRFFEEAKKRKLLDRLKIYFFSYLPDGRPIDEDLLDYYLHMEPMKADFYRADLSRLAPEIPFVNSLNYDNRTGRFDAFDGLFYSKLVNVQNILIGQQRSPGQKELINLIKHFSNIVRIRFRMEQWDADLQEFLNFLPQHCPHMRTLQFSFPNAAVIPFLDLRFAFRLPELYSFLFYGRPKLRHRVDYLLLQAKLKLKRKQIALINGRVLFNQDLLDFSNFI